MRKTPRSMPPVPASATPAPTQPMKLHPEQFWRLKSLVGDAHLAQLMAAQAASQLQARREAVNTLARSLGIPWLDFTMDDEALVVGPMPKRADGLAAPPEKDMK